METFLDQGGGGTTPTAQKKKKDVTGERGLQGRREGSATAGLHWTVCAPRSRHGTAQPTGDLTDFVCASASRLVHLASSGPRLRGPPHAVRRNTVLATPEMDPQPSVNISVDGGSLSSTGPLKAVKPRICPYAGRADCAGRPLTACHAGRRGKEPARLSNGIRLPQPRRGTHGRKVWETSKTG